MDDDKEKGSTLIGKNLLFEEQILSLRVDAFKKGGNIENGQVSSLESELIHHKYSVSPRFCMAVELVINYYIQ